MVDETSGLRCRNCGNTGISPWTGEPCGCKHGKALAHLATGKEANETTKLRECEVCHVNTWCSLEQWPALVQNGYFMITVWVCNACLVKRAEYVQIGEQLAAESPQITQPRATVRHFALAMERKLAANDATKGTWRNTGTFALLGMARTEFNEFVDALHEYVNLEDKLSEFDSDRAWLLDDARQALLLEAADCANYLAMICDACGALPPTDERGR